jgi:uncharacterized protein with PIN domain
MPDVTCRFYEELNDFLPAQKRKIPFSVRLERGASLKDLLQDQGVPHGEVDLILANGASVGFEYLPEDGDRISVYPVFESLNIEKVTRLREKPLRKTRFVADTGLERLTIRLRLLGFDVSHSPLLSLEGLKEISRSQMRIILTARKEIFESGGVTRGILVCQANLWAQVRGIIESLDLWKSIKLFSRCHLCNRLLDHGRRDCGPLPMETGSRTLSQEQIACQACGQSGGV